jgi:hypothetical protein
MLNKNVLSKFLSCTLLLSGIILFTSFAASATTYYVATNGNNSRTTTQAQNINTPWLTISKAASVMGAGDTCYIRGGTYRETITPTNSGSSGSKITYANFNGEVVTVNGTDLLTNWSLDSGNVYKAWRSMSFASGNQVFVNGALMEAAKWPNNTGTTLFTPTLATADSASATTITDADLTQNCNGGEIWCLSGAGWEAERSTITGYSNNTITFSALSDAPVAGNKYYVTGLKTMLDTAKEWWYDKNSGYVYLWQPGGGNPSTSTVEVRQRACGFDLSGHSYIDITGINFFSTGLYTDAATSNCVFSNINAQYTMNGNAEHGGIRLYGSNLELKNSTIQYSSKYIVEMKGTGNKVVNCLLQTGNYEATWDALVKISGGSGHLISDNTILEAGRACLGGSKFSNCQIQYNNMYNAGRMTNDLGVIYIGNADGGNTRVRHNLIHDNFGAQHPLGIYFDNYSANFVIDHNVVWGVEDALRLNTPSNNMLAYNNTLIGSAYSVKHWGIDYLDDMYGARVFNNICSSNILVAGGTVRGNNIYSATDPLYVDAANHNYRLTTSSPAKNTGTVLSGITDGAVGTPDIGAYEFGGTDWTAGHNFTTPPNHTFNNISAPYMNLVSNPGFETSLLAPWTGMGGTYSVVNEVNSAWNNPTGVARSHYYGMRLGGTTGQSSGVIQTINNLYPNTTYVASAWLKSSGFGVESVEIGVMDFGGTQVNSKTYSTSWDQRAVEFTTGATNTSAKVYIWKNTMGAEYVYADAIALTPKDPNTKPDSFESGFGAWTHYPIGTPATAGTIVHGAGSTSYRVVADYDYIQKTVYSLYNKIASVWFYDYQTTRDDSMITLARIDDNVIAKGIGVNTNTSTTNYSILNGGTYTATSVARSAGWHELKFDYSSGDGLKMYIDNTLVSTTTDVKAFSYIRLGDMWSDSKTCTDSYFDDFKIQDIDVIQ